MPSKHHTHNPHDWNASNVLDDVDFQEHEARQFRDLLYGKDKTDVSSCSCIRKPSVIHVLDFNMKVYSKWIFCEFE